MSLYEAGICYRNQPLMKKLKSVVRRREPVLFYNTQAEVDRLVEVLAEDSEILAALSRHSRQCRKCSPNFPAAHGGLCSAAITSVAARGLL